MSYRVKHSRPLWVVLALFGILLCMVLGISKVDKLSCERQTQPRAALLQFLQGAAAVSEGRYHDYLISEKLQTTPAKKALVVNLAQHELFYHRRAVKIASEVKSLSCSGFFPTATGAIHTPASVG